MKKIKEIFEEIYKKGGQKVVFSKGEKENILNLKKQGIKIRKAKHKKKKKRGISIPKPKSSQHRGETPKTQESSSAEKN